MIGVLVLTGLKDSVLRKLEQKGVTTVELISFANVRTSSLLSQGERVFLTTDAYEELSRGTDGIVAEVVGIDISPVRINMEHIDEKELQRARIKVRFLSYGRVKNVRMEETAQVDLIVLENTIIL